MTESFDVVVIGAGHAGIEAALACARMGQKTLLLTLNLDAVALMPCNPSIGGTAKGHLVREVDALGGAMGLAIDATFLQSRMLNRGKGPAVYSLRAQADKAAYHSHMLGLLLRQPGLSLRQAEVQALHTQNGVVCAVSTTTGQHIPCRAVIVASGVYMDSRIIIGEAHWQGGPQGLLSSQYLGQALRDLGLRLQRFKTGTPARVLDSSIDFDQMTPQPGDEQVVPFSFLTEETLHNRSLCYLTYTNEQTHDLIRQNLSRAPMYTGGIDGTGARYCPSIEDKVMRFADKDRHQIFVEPEGMHSQEWYIQGMSTSLPEDVQIEMYRTILGLHRAQLLRLAYAIEYECIDPTQLHHTLAARGIPGLYMAGQVNGTSGYEEAAAQGLLAGVNAALWLSGKPPLILGRQDAYIGVLVDDLVLKGTGEPYRMMTSRAEYRLLLRQDNADLRLTEKGYEVGLVSEERYRKMCRKRDAVAAVLPTLEKHRYPPNEALQTFLQSHGEPETDHSLTAQELLRRQHIRYQNLEEIDPEYQDAPEDVAEQVSILTRYEGYLKKQQAQVAQFEQNEHLHLPEDTDYLHMSGLRIEAQQKLDAMRPASVGQASRISGVSPGDIAVLMVYLSRLRRQQAVPASISERAMPADDSEEE